MPVVGHGSDERATEDPDRAEADAGAFNYDNSVAVTNQVWVVGAPVLTVLKTEALLADGLGGVEGYIPGATIEYAITITYASGSGTASSVNVSDTVPANTVMLTAIGWP